MDGEEERGSRVPPVIAPPLPGPALVRQGWSGVVFLHWSVEPERVARLLPEGTRPDLFDGTTYVGIVAFHAPFTRVLGLSPIGAFDEVNVRLYSVDGWGRRGVVFLTMDADSLPAVLAARAVPGAPYMWSDIALRQRGFGRCAGAVVRRRPQRGTRGRWSLRAEAGRADPTPLEHFLTARWGLHTPWAGATRWIRVSHEPWRLHRATDVSYEGDLLTRAGVVSPRGAPVSALWSPGVVAEVTPTLPPA
ncbi:YqjF family protein [Nocardiopsis alba]|uniref:YqjF family protein n=1 Tax=Nocardiopsis alba TaxID=53437 RepID=UPI0033B01F40